MRDPSNEVTPSVKVAEYIIIPHVVIEVVNGWNVNTKLLSPM
jgi:hypothetical protein